MSNYKFRVWDSIEKVFIYPDMVYLKDGEGLVYFGTPSVGEVIGKVWHKREENPFILNLCTGLKDSEGNEIYEGDVIEDSLGTRRQICFGKYLSKGWRGFDSENCDEDSEYNNFGFYDVNIDLFYCDKGIYDPFDNYDKSYKIIGNIYQNTELFDTEYEDEEE